MLTLRLNEQLFAADILLFISKNNFFDLLQLFIFFDTKVILKHMNFKKPGEYNMCFRDKRNDEDLFRNYIRALCSLIDEYIIKLNLQQKFMHVKDLYKFYNIDCRIFK